MKLDLPAALVTSGARRPTRPVLLSSPHSGAALPPGLLDALAIGVDELRPLSDGPVDRLLGFAEDLGVSLVAAGFSRAVIDLNRGPDEIEPGLLCTPQGHSLEMTPRVRAGLGLIPTRVGGAAIWSRRLDDDELFWRRRHVHAPFHAALERGAAKLAARFGHSLLLDCHSMPGCVAGPRDRRYDLVLGDLNGKAARPALVRLAVETLRGLGLRPALNVPYAGGYITARHGRPTHGRSAIQLEIRRDLFMDEATQELHEGARAISDALRELVRTLGDALLGERQMSNERQVSAA